MAHMTHPRLLIASFGATRRGASLVYRWHGTADRDRAGGARRDELVRPDHVPRRGGLGRRLPAHRPSGDPGRTGPAGGGPARSARAAGSGLGDPSTLGSPPAVSRPRTRE